MTNFMKVEPQQKQEEINEIYRKNEFAVQVVARGAFLDNDPSYGGKVLSEIYERKAGAANG